MAGGNEGFKSPADFIQYLSAGNFVDAGAALNESAPLSICLAALKALEAKQVRDLEASQTTQSLN